MNKNTGFTVTAQTIFLEAEPALNQCEYNPTICREVLPFVKRRRLQL
jgi:hypothetical protein